MHQKTLPLLFIASALPALGEFTAYNDIVGGAGAHPNTTLYAPNATPGGPMKDIMTGADTPVNLTVTQSGVNYESATGVPASATDAGAIFLGYVDFSTGNPHSLALSGSDTFTYSFSGLTSSSRYGFAGTAVRGESDYTNRWTLVSIEGADAFTAAHSAGIGVVTSGLAANEVAIWTGDNSQSGQGFVAAWTDVDPGSDGVFSVVSRQYAGPTPGVGSGIANGSKGYGINGIRLVETLVVGQPMVMNQPAADITEAAARLSGEITDPGSDTPEVTLYWGDDDAGSVAGNWDSMQSIGSQSGSFDTLLGSLNPATTYYFRYFAQNSTGGSWASPSQSFTTLALPPTVSNLAAENIFAFSADLGAEVVGTGGGNPEVTIFYGTSDGGTDEGAWQQSVDLGAQSGPATASVSGLFAGVTYHFRARATNSGGSAWALASETFVTSEVTLPEVENQAATGVTGNSAVLNGSVTDPGGDPPAVRIFYGLSDAGTNVGDWDGFVDVGAQSGEYSQLATNLTSESIYYFRARATNGAGESWASSSLSFSTPVYTPPSIVINEIHYDESDKTRRVEFIELHNLSHEPVELNGWELSAGVGFEFPAGAIIAPNSFLVVAENPEELQAWFGYSEAFGPWTGKLKNSGETVTLRDTEGTLVSRVDYQLGFPWPTVGDQVGSPSYSPSIQLIHPLLETDLGGSWRSGKPSPGAQNEAFAIAAPPQVRQVDHHPKQPASGDPVVIEALVTDPDGVAVVALAYQLVDPGDYFCRYEKFNNNGTPNLDSRYEDPGEWTSLPMADNGLAGDEFAGDGIYSVALPGPVQTNRRLVRYRISVEDGVGNALTVPYADDPQPNFAYFVYDGTPDWSGVIRSGDTPVNHPGSLMSSIPTYFLLSKSSWVDDSQFGGYAGSEYLWPGTMIYDGEVYDHIRYRPRGGTHRFQYGKNFWKFDFNRGHRFQARDEYGRKYNTEWSKLNFSSIVQQVGFQNRGEQGLFESLGFRLFQLSGVEASETHHVQFYVVDNASPTGANQYEGDYYGLFLAIEQMDGQFLDQHDLPDGNLYKIEGHSGLSNNQGPTQVTNGSDVSTFISAYRNGNPRAQWWRDNLDLEKYFSYRAIVEGIHHYDIAGGKNYFYYNNPETGRFEVHPWDLDLTWADNMYGNGNHDFKAKVADNPSFNTDYQNRMREIMDLLYNADEGFRLVDEMVQDVWAAGQPSLVGADRRLWDNHPRINHLDRYYDISSTGDFDGMIQRTKNYIVSRGGWMTANILSSEGQVPVKPTISHTGEPGFPTNDLSFSCSGYSSPSGSDFAAMEWRVAEIHNPDVPGHDPTEPNIYEIEGGFESGELSVFAADYQFPAAVVEVGRTYRARVRFKDIAGRFGHWSDPVEFTATTPDISDYIEYLRISEFMYQPSEPAGGEAAVSTNRDDFEFVELKNVGPSALDLRDLRFTEGIDFEFEGSDIEQIDPGGFVLVVSNIPAFEARYGTGLPVAGAYPNNLSNGGERVKLSFGVDTAIHDIDEYDDMLPWPEEADGVGFSLVLSDVDQVGTPDHDDPASWRLSRFVGGSPGADDSLVYEDWKILNGVVDDHSDDDHDGLTAFLEFFLGGDPNVSSPGLLPVGLVETMEVAGVPSDYLTLTFQREIAADGTSHMVEFSTDLEDWDAVDGVLMSREVSGADDGLVTEVWRAASPRSAGDTLFGRLRVQK